MSARNDYAAWTAAEFDKAFPNRSNPDDSLVWLTISDVRTEDLTTGANNWLTRFPDAAVVKPDGPEFFRASGSIDAMQNKLFGKYYPEDIYGTLAEVGDIVAADSAYDDLGTWCAFCGNDEVPCTCSGTAYGADCKNQHDLLMNAWLGFGLWIFCCILCYVIFGRGYLAGIAIGVASRLTRSAHATSAKYVKLQYPSDTTENKVFQIVIGHPVFGGDGKPVIKDGLYAPIPRLPNTLLVTAPKNAAGKFFRQPVTWDGRAMPSETPLEDVPPNLADAPTQREVYRAMRSQYVKRCVLAPIMLIFLMLNDIVKIASTICLLLRSMQAIIPWIDIDFDIELRFDEIFSLMYECAVAVSESLAPVADAFVQIFKWLFFALDLSNILDMFTIGINVTCEGSQQPWYLLGNLMIVTAIVLMASADLADPMRFKKMWRTFISQRRMVFSHNNIGEVFSAALDFFQNSVMYEKAELVFAYMLQTLCTLVSTRCGALRIKDDGSSDFFYTAACNVQETDNIPHMEKFVSVAVFLVSWLVLPPFLMLILSSFAHSIGPAPPITREHLIAMRVQHEERLNRPKPKTCQQRLCGKKNEDETDGADSEMPAEQGGAPPKVEDEEVGVELSVADADKGETKVEEEGETSRDSTAHQFKEFTHDDVLEEQRLFWPNRFGDYRARLESQHEVLSRDGFIRASINESSWRHVYRVTVWKLWQLVKLSCGVWDRDAFLATRILPRADILIRHDLTEPEERHPKGLQLHQDLISATGRMVATFFCLLPAGAFLSKTSEAVNASPLFVTDRAVDRDGHAVWESKIDGDDGKARTRGIHAFGRMWPPLRPVAQGNDAIIVLNASFRYRLFGFVLAVVQMLLIFIVCFKPTIQTVAAMLIWMLICEVKVIVLEHEDQQFYRRRTEWYRRYFEALRGGHHGTSLWIAGHETKLSSSGGAPHLLNNAPLPHEAFPSGTENRLIMSIPPHGGGSRPLRNADALRGHWVLMDRGSITFSEKARKAHAAGAVGLVLINNDMQAPDAIPQMSGDTGDEVKIPILGISYNAGRRAKKLAVHGADQGAKIELVIDDQKHAKGLRKAEGGDKHSILELLGLKAPKVPEEEPETPGSGVDDAAMAAGAQERLAKLRTQFEAMDVNQNGFIDVAELKTSLSKFADETGEGETVSDEMLQAMVTEADINKDGQIDFAEFKKMHERVAFVSLSPRKSAFAKQWQKVYGLDDYDEDDVGDLVDETEMIELKITIPPNVKPGAMVATQTEYGIIHVPVPEGSEPGEEIQFKIKKPAPQEQPQAGNVNNPADWTAVIDASVKALLPEPENARVLHIVTEKSIGLRNTPTFPGERNGFDVVSGSMYCYSRVSTVSLPSGKHIRMYELADGRGWVHDYDPEAQDEIGAVACSLVRTTLSPGSLGTIFSEPDLNKGGGHAVVSFRPGSPLKAAGILPNDALVMVDQVPVSGHTQEEMVEVFRAGANRNKTMVFIRRVGESDIDEFGRDMSVLALVDVAAGSRVVHVKTDKSIGLREGSTFPGVRNGSDIMSGSIMPFTKRVELASAVEGGEVVCMYEMTNGRGWLHDYDPDMPNKKGALPFVVVRAVVPPNTKLGVMFEEPELKFGGGHMVLQLQPDSVLATGGVHEKDLLVLVDRHCVAGLLQEELVAFVQSRAAEQKTLVFLRQVDNIKDSEEVPVNAPLSKSYAAPHQADSAPAAAATAPVNESNEPEQSVTNRLARTFSGLGGLLGGGGEPSATTLGEETEHSEA